jgi:hypothetical protein
LYQHRKKLREERNMIFQDNNSISREEYWEDYSEDSEYSRESAETQNITDGRQHATERKGIQGVLHRI